MCVAKSFEYKVLSKSKWDARGWVTQVQSFVQAWVDRPSTKYWVFPEPEWVAWVNQVADCRAPRVE